VYALAYYLFYLFTCVVGDLSLYLHSGFPNTMYRKCMNKNETKIFVMLFFYRWCIHTQLFAYSGANKIVCVCKE